VLVLETYDTHDAFGQGNAGINRPITVMTMQLCAKGAPVGITTIRLDNRHSIRLLDWGWRVWQNGTAGGQPGLARTLYPDLSRRPIDVACSRHDPGADMEITVERTGPETGTMSGYTVLYPGGELRVPFGIALCKQICTEAEMDSTDG
jgi:hypothetical protein